MRISELLEARTPVEAVRVIFAPDKSGAMIIGGRVLRDERITIPKVFNKLNLKNVKNPGPGPLLFHGSIDKFSKFNNRRHSSGSDSVELFIITLLQMQTRYK